MMSFLLEDETIFDYCQKHLISQASGPALSPLATGAAIQRDEQHRIIIEIIYDGALPDESRHRSNPGTVFSANESISFKHITGANSVANGVVYHGLESTEGLEKTLRSIETYSATSLDLTVGCDKNPFYTIEWVSNLPRHLLSPGRVVLEQKSSFTESFGHDKDRITIFGSSQSIRSESALHLQILNLDLFIMMGSISDQTGRGRIVYAGCPSEDIRERLRDCVSFTLGQPIIYDGCTSYSEDWRPISMKAVEPFSFEGRMRKLNQEPPFPITMVNENYMVDSRAVEQICTALASSYESMDMKKLIPLYWHARCAPLHTAAVYYGGVIERVLRRVGSAHSKLLSEPEWRALRTRLEAAIASTSIDSAAAGYLKSRLSSLNQVSPNVKLDRVFTSLGMKIDHLELGAWKQRNAAAHGEITDNDVKQVILNSRLLQLIFHRLIAAVTQGSAKYIDYYSLNFPIRKLVEAVPQRL